MAFDPYADQGAPGGAPLGLLDQLSAGPAEPDAMPLEEETGDDAGGGDPVSVLRGILADLTHYLDVEQDEEDKAKAARAIQIVQDLLATNQKQADSAMGVTDQHRFMRRQQP